jgi:hypothetical protein
MITPIPITGSQLLKYFHIAKLKVIMFFNMGN